MKTTASQPDDSKMISSATLVDSCLGFLPTETWSVALLISLLIIHRYMPRILKDEADVPKLYHRDSGFMRSVLRRCPRLKAPFSPPFWARNSHIQTFLSHIFSRADVQFDREFVEMKDGGLVALDWSETPESHQNLKRNTLMLILPGLTGDANGVSYLCKYAIRAGLTPVVYNRRGHGGCPLLTPDFSGYADPSDLRQTINFIKNKYNYTEMVAVGVSTGSALLMSYLSEFGSSSGLHAAVCISPEYKPHQLLKQGLPSSYDFYATFKLKSLAMDHARILGQSVDMDRILQAKTLMEVDAAMRNIHPTEVEKYWQSNDPMKDIDDISVPLLLINSKDDPVVPSSLIPYDIFDIMPNLVLARTYRGGHAAFLEGSNLEPWADKLSVDFLAASLEVLRKQAIVSSSKSNDSTETNFF